MVGRDGQDAERKCAPRACPGATPGIGPCAAGQNLRCLDFPGQDQDEDQCGHRESEHIENERDDRHDASRQPRPLTQHPERKPSAETTGKPAESAPESRDGERRIDAEQEGKARADGHGQRAAPTLNHGYAANVPAPRRR